ncbi:MAG: carbohydrate deacetylase [Planctomycetota bacterium]|jgi:hopanoid biosynthesis associated protein HpnK
MDRTIVINADDFGLCEGVNKAVAKAHTDGVLTSTTIMANMPAAAEAVEIAKKMPTLGVGVHLNLTDGRPLSQRDAVGPLLDAEGRFACSSAKLAFLSLAGPKSRNAIRTELAAQIRWLSDHGIKPTHLDSHKHFHAFPVLFSIVCQLARRFGIPAIRFAREPADASGIPWPLPGQRGKSRAAYIRAMAKVNRFQNSDFLKTDALLGIAHAGRIDVNFFRAVALYNSAQTAEVMTHPGFIDGLEPESTGLVNQRKVELDALCDERTKRFFQDAGTKLVHYGQL